MKISTLFPAFCCASLIMVAPVLASVWDVVALNGQPVEGEPMIEFSPDGGLSGSTGCNRFITSASASKAGLVLAGPIAMTRMACPGDTLSKQENAFVKLLESTVDMQFDPFSETVILTRDGISLTLKPKLAE